MNKDLTEDNIPAYYELVVKDAGTLLIRVHIKAMNAVIEMLKKDSPIIQGHIDEFPKHHFDPFILPQIEKAWGYGEILVPIQSEEQGWLVYECKIPQHGKNVLALRSTLDILFTALTLFKEETNCKRNQLIVVDYLLVRNKDIYGGALTVTLTPTVSRWLSEKKERFRLVEVEKAMMMTDVHMHPDIEFGRFHKDEFRVSCQGSKFVNFQIPGNACGLDPENYHDPDPNIGYRLCPHNTDTSSQQLMLLVGIAKLQDIIRKEVD